MTASVFSEILETVAPGRDDLVVLLQSFFDESYSDSLLCVAGYAFTKPAARKLDRSWGKMLWRYKRLPYFRMSACNAGKPPFDRLSEQQRIDIATEAIGLIGQHAAFGYAVTVDQAAFRKIVTDKGFVSSPYEACAWFCLLAVKDLADKERHQHAGLSFIFESGFRDKGRAEHMMNRLFSVPELREFYRYRSHTFADKTRSRGCQAADLLAWQWYKDSVRRANGATKPRGDLRALLAGGPKHAVLHLGADRLQLAVDVINSRAGTPLGNIIGGIALREPKHPIFPKRSGEVGNAEAWEKLKSQFENED